MMHAHVPQHFLNNTLPISAIVNLSTEVFPVDAHLVHHYVDELVLLGVLPPLNDDTVFDFPMEEDVSEEDDFEVEIVTANISVVPNKGKGRKRTRGSQRL